MAAVLYLTPPKPAAAAPFFPHLSPPLRGRLPSIPSPRRPSHHGPISAARRIPSSPPTAPPGQLYQPFRPPPSPLPAKYRSLGPTERLDILRDRLGLWFEYAPLISTLAQDGFTPPSIEEVTGMSSVEQNRLVVGAQVRDSLLSSSLDPDLLSYFDAAAGADLLYEIRLLNAAQRSAAAARLAALRLDPKAAQEIARAIKDFPRRRGDVGWDRFSAASPGDCLAYTYFRLSREAISVPDKVAALEKAGEAAETDTAKARIEEEMERVSSGAESEDDDGEAVDVRVQVVRLRYGEVAEATTVRLLPVCREGDGEAGLAAAPGKCRVEGELGVVAAEREWGRWVVLPAWQPVAAAEAGVAVEFADARAFPWRVNRWEKEEVVLVVADRGRREVAEENGFYVVGGEGEKKGRLVVERGRKLLEEGVKEALGTVVLVVRPPNEEEEDQLSDEDWV